MCDHLQSSLPSPLGGGGAAWPQDTTVGCGRCSGGSPVGCAPAVGPLWEKTKLTVGKSCRAILVHKSLGPRPPPAPPFQCFPAGGGGAFWSFLPSSRSPAVCHTASGGGGGLHAFPQGSGTREDCGPTWRLHAMAALQRTHLVPCHRPPIRPSFETGREVIASPMTSLRTSRKFGERR